MTVLCIVLGLFVGRAMRQRAAVELLLKVHAEIQYDCDTGPRQTSHRIPQLIDPNYLHSVTRLILDAPAANDESLALLEALPHLEVLMITEGSDVSNDGLRQLRSVPGLKCLVLASGSIDDRGLGYVAALSGLEELDIHNQSRITDAGILRLAELKRLRRLTIWNTGAKKISVACLQSSLPNCEIDYLPPDE